MLLRRRRTLTRRLQVKRATPRSRCRLSKRIRRQAEEAVEVAEEAVAVEVAEVAGGAVAEVSEAVQECAQ
jgi:metal-sulfur cluster biosynthetic enzyme